MKAEAFASAQRRPSAPPFATGCASRNEGGGFRLRAVTPRDAVKIAQDLMPQ